MKVQWDAFKCVARVWIFLLLCQQKEEYHSMDHNMRLSFNPLLLLLNSWCTSSATERKTDLGTAYSNCRPRCTAIILGLLVQRRCVRKRLACIFQQKRRDSKDKRAFPRDWLPCKVVVIRLHEPTWQLVRANRISTPQEVEANHGSALSPTVMEITQLVCCRWEQCYLAQHASFHTQASALKTGQTAFYRWVSLRSSQMPFLSLLTRRLD